MSQKAGQHFAGFYGNSTYQDWTTFAMNPFHFINHSLIFYFFGEIDGVVLIIP